MPDPEKLMNFEQLRKACSDAPRGVPLLVAEAIWRRDLVQKIGHQSYPSWFEAALKRHGGQLHRELYLKEDPSQPLNQVYHNCVQYGEIKYDWMDELRQQQQSMTNTNANKELLHP